MKHARGHCTIRVIATEEIFPKVAMMVVIPVASAVVRPLLVIVATAGLEESHVTSVVISWLVPSEYVPVAVSC